MLLGLFLLIHQCVASVQQCQVGYKVTIGKVQRMQQIGNVMQNVDYEGKIGIIVSRHALNVAGDKGEYVYRVAVRARREAGGAFVEVYQQFVDYVPCKDLIIRQYDEEMLKAVQAAASATHGREMDEKAREMVNYRIMYTDLVIREGVQTSADGLIKYKSLELAKKWRAKLIDGPDHAERGDIIRLIQMDGHEANKVQNLNNQEAVVLERMGDTFKVQYRTLVSLNKVSLTKEVTKVVAKSFWSVISGGFNSIKRAIFGKSAAPKIENKQLESDMYPIIEVHKKHMAFSQYTIRDRRVAKVAVGVLTQALMVAGIIDNPECHVPRGSNVFVAGLTGEPKRYLNFKKSFPVSKVRLLDDGREILTIDVPVGWGQFVTILDADQDGLQAGAAALASSMAEKYAGSMNGLAQKVLSMGVDSKKPLNQVRADDLESERVMTEQATFAANQALSDAKGDIYSKFFGKSNYINEFEIPCLNALIDDDKLENTPKDLACRIAVDDEVLVMGQSEQHNMKVASVDVDADGTFRYSVLDPKDKRHSITKDLKCHDLILHDGTEAFQRARYHVYKSQNPQTYAKYVTALVKYGFPERTTMDDPEKDLAIAQEAQRVLGAKYSKVASAAVAISERRVSDKCSFDFRRGQRVVMIRMTGAYKRYNGRSAIISNFNSSTGRYYISPRVAWSFGAAMKKVEIPNIKCSSLRPT